MRLYLFILIFFINFSSNSLSEIIKKIDVIGNDRISNDTIILFSGAKINDEINTRYLNDILNNLYETNFFEDVNVKVDKDNLLINVVERPIIESIIYRGVKAKKIKEEIVKNNKLKDRSSFNKVFLKEDEINIKNTLRNLGYYFSKVETLVEKLDKNKVKIIFDVELGKKAKIKKINFIGDKIYKDRKLRNIILSEEYKFWKFISGKKYLNEDLIEFDKRLLKNFYLNQGYFDVVINSSFAKLIAEDEFELNYNINAKKKFYFDKISLELPNDFQPNNYKPVEKFYNDLKGKPYSLNSVEKILERIDQITTSDEFKTINAYVNEEINENRINLTFVITESEKFIVERINIFGNNVTRESVIRNQLVLDEGDPFNEILQKKSINNIKSLNFFKEVDSEVITGSNNQTKIININVREKPTGEIMAGAGFGTSGSTFTFGVKENNYLGKGLGVDANATISTETFRGKLSITNPNYKNTDKLLFANIQSSEVDRLSNFGYKSNKSGFELGTQFEYLKQFNLGISTRSFYEKIETDSTASARQQKQKGNYFDSFIKVNFDNDKRNQKFRTTEGFRSFYSIDAPVISETNTLTNTYSFKLYSELYENNTSTLSLYLKNTNSISGDDVKLSERLFIPSSRLRGFESGKVGPKDGDDFVGGNYLATLNFTSTLPKILEDNQNVDLVFFFDAGNIWGVDYDSSLDDASQLRTSVGLAVDMFTPIGPLNFSLTETLSKHKNDITESFRFNIGTSF